MHLLKLGFFDQLKWTVPDRHVYAQAQKPTTDVITDHLIKHNDYVFHIPSSILESFCYRQKTVAFYPEGISQKR